ncbi:ABC transporter permease [Timonella sp. A28]|uniref:ABC transporter permease n=1 Tax=Timonella sp. A28 TaxID=3442640 RepID=UPI003EBC7D43
MSSVPNAPVFSQPRPTLQRVVAQSVFEVNTLLRNGEQLMVAFLLPLGLLVLLTQTSVMDIDTGGASRTDFFVPGIIAIALMSSAFTSQAISTAFDRRNGVLRFLATTPLGRDGLLYAKTFAVLSIFALQFCVLVVLALFLGWDVSFAHILLGLPALLLGIATFTSAALFVAGTLRPEGVIALANIILVVLIVGGGVLVPASELPAWLAPVAQFLPSGALGDSLRAAFIDGTVHVGSLLILTGWAALFSFAARRYFAWQA